MPVCSKLVLQALTANNYPISSYAIKAILNHQKDQKIKRCSQPLNFKTLGFITMVERVELCPPFGRVHLGRPPCQGSWRCGQEGGLRPDRRDLGAMEEQDEGSIGRSPNLSFRESESFFSNGQPV